jgi:hypothetical protein
MKLVPAISEWCPKCKHPTMKVYEDRDGVFAKCDRFGCNFVMESIAYIEAIDICVLCGRPITADQEFQSFGEFSGQYVHKSCVQ